MEERGMTQKNHASIVRDLRHSGGKALEKTPRKKIPQENSEKKLSD